MPTERTSDQLFSFAFRNATPLRKLTVSSGFILLGATVIAALEPQASEGLPFLWAVFHWLVHFAGGIAILVAVYITVLRADIPGHWAIAFAIGASPFGVALISMVFDALTALLTGVSDTLPDSYWQELQQVAVPVLSLSTLLLIAILSVSKLAAGYQAELTKHFKKKPTLRSVFSELSTDLGDDLIYLSANDHYVHLRTSLGSAMMSRRFSDCVEMLSDFEGIQVHRSHWVALKHIVKIQPKGSSYVCILRDSSEIPVSRRKYSDLKLHFRDYTQKH